MPERDIIEAELTQVDLEGTANAKNLEEYWRASVGRTLYGKLIDNQSKKMWMLDDNTLIDEIGWSPKGAALKEGPWAAWDVAISCYPWARNGYDDYFDIATADATVLLEAMVTWFNIPDKTIVLNGEKTYEIIISTVSPDFLFEICHGELPYIGRDFHPMLLPVENAFPDGTCFLYFVGKEHFTRIVEYKKLTVHEALTTLIGLEIPCANGRHYPMPITSENARADRYFAEKPHGVFSIGRAGSYRYVIDNDDCIEQAMEIARFLV